MQQIRRYVFLTLVLAGLWLAGARPAASQLAPVNRHPVGATQSLAVGVNNSGLVVGEYVVQSYDESGRWLGTSSTAVIWNSAGAMTELVDETWTGGNTCARGINDSGQVFGSISLPDGASTGAFIWNNGSIVNVPKLVHNGVPDWEFTPQAMNDNGWLIGSSYTYSGVHGWIYRNGVDSAAEEIRNPEVPDGRIAAFAINNKGQVAGHAYYGSYSAVIWEKDESGNVVISDLAPSVVGSEARGINNAGQVVIQGQNGNVYLWTNASLMPVPLPSDYDAWTVQVVGIDDTGRIFGTALRGASPRLWMWQTGVLTECPVPGPQLADYDTFRINKVGQMTGFVRDSDGTPRGFLWKAADGASGLQMLDGLEGGRSAGLGLNDAGEVAGYAPVMESFDWRKRACIWGVAAPTNHPPVLSVPASDTIAEAAPYSFTAAAIDPDGDGLTFSLTDAPQGAGIDSETGLFTWTPSEAQGPGVYAFGVSVTDGTDSVSQVVTLSVTEVNQVPTLDLPSDGYAYEESAISFLLPTTDADLPTQALSFSATDLPEGAILDPVNGLFTWTPSEAQGPGVYTFAFTVTDDGTPALSASQTITMTVDEVNRSPMLSVPTRVSGTVGSAVTFAATAADPDVPANPLAFSLSGAPAGAAIEPATRVYTTVAMASGDYSWDVIVADGGGLSDTKQITVNVSPAITVGKAIATTKGKSVTVAVPLTNRSATVATNVALSTATLGGAPASVSLKASTISPGATVIGNLTFKAVPPGKLQLVLNGISSLGGFSSTQMVKVP